VAYWPLDSVDLTQNTTPDLVAGNNLQLYNITDTSVLTPGKFGQAFSLDGTVQQLAYFTAPPGSDLGLPITHNPAYSVLYCGRKGLEPGNRTCAIFPNRTLRMQIIIRCTLWARTKPA
jgi:hypothetical protein